MKTYAIAYLLATINDVFGVRQTANAGPSYYRMVSRWGVSDLHSTELEE